MASGGRSATIRRSVVRGIVKRPLRINRRIIHTRRWAEILLAAIADSTSTTILFLRGAPTIRSVTGVVQATPPNPADVGTGSRSTHAVRGVLLPFQPNGLSKAHAPSITRHASYRASSLLSWEIILLPTVHHIVSLWAQSIHLLVSNIRTNVIAERDGREEWSPRVRLPMTAQCLVKATIKIRTVAVVLGESKCTNILRDNDVVI